MDETKHTYLPTYLLRPTKIYVDTTNTCNFTPVLAKLDFSDLKKWVVIV